MKNLIILATFILVISPFVYAQKIEHSSSPTKTIPTVSYCELIRNPDRYDRKTIRVKATLLVSFEVSTLEDSQCDIGRSIWVEFDGSHNSCTPKRVRKSFDNIFNSSEVGRSTRGEIIAIGRFEMARKIGTRPTPSGFGHLDQYPYQLTIKCLEQVHPAPTPPLHANRV